MNATDRNAEHLRPRLLSKLSISGFIAIAGLVSTGVGHAAEDATVGAAQRELKRQQYYYGEITNQLDDATRSAVRRFQIRRGLNVSGDLDSSTLAVLATNENATAAAPATTSTEEQPPA